MVYICTLNLIDLNLVLCIYFLLFKIEEYLNIRLRLITKISEKYCLLICRPQSRTTSSSIYQSIIHQCHYSGMSLVRRARDRDFFYGLNLLRTKRCDSVRIFPLPYTDLYNQIDVACLTAPSIWGLVPWIFSNGYGAKSQIQCSRYI